MMTTTEVADKFREVIQDKAAMKSIGATKYQLYNWRNPDRQETKLGTQLEVLFKLGHLKMKE